MTLCVDNALGDELLESGGESKKESGCGEQDEFISSEFVNRERNQRKSG